MITKIDLEKTQEILGYNFEYIPENKLTLLWTDYLDTYLIVNLLKNSDKILELGTYKGHTTENIANNTACSKLITVDIYKEAYESNTKFQKHELLNKIDVGCVITSNKVTQYFGTTDAFFKENTEMFNGIFVDASHDYENVLNDSINALNSLSPEGIIVWHDVYNLDGACQRCNSEPNNDGVVKALEDLTINGEKINTFKVGRSWIAFYKK
jgi:predicted O-methyltransferase YrrM